MRFSALLFFLLAFPILASSQADRLHLVISEITVTGNKRTQENIILRELNFGVGDTLDLLTISDVFNENKNRLLNTQLFNFVTISLGQITGNYTSIDLVVEERWYIWPEVYLMQADRNLSNWLRDTDFSRVKYGIGFSHYNFRGKREKLGIRFIGGFVKQYAVTYNNIYLDKKLRHSIDISFLYDAPNKFVYDVQNNEELVVKTDNTIMRKYESVVTYRFRNKHYIQHSLMARYRGLNITDTLYVLNNEYLNNNSTTLHYPDLTYSFNFDNRDSKHYPLEGANFNALVRYEGIGNPGNEFLRFELKAQKATELVNAKLYSDFLVKGVYSTSDRRPLFSYDELGYTNNIRGFEYYVGNGKSAFIDRNTLKFKPFQTQVVELSYLPIPSINKVPLTFYLNLFVDFAYVQNDNDAYLAVNNLPNNFLYALGGGIDLVTYYDRTLSLFYAYNSFGKGKIYFTIVNSL